MWSSSAGRSNPAQIKFRNKCNSIPSLDKLLKVHIEKHTWQSLDRKYCCRNVVSCWKDHRVPSLISALVTWGVIAQQLLTVLILGAGQVLQTCSSQSSGSPEVTGSGTASGTRTANPGASFPVPTQISRLSYRHLHHLCFHRVFLKQTLVNKAFFLPPLVLENLQANPGSFPLEMHFLQM